MEYRHLTEGERYQIEALSKAKKSPTYIAQQLGRSKSTISRELARNSGRRIYRAAEAQQRYRQQLIEKGRERQCWHLVFDEVAVPLLTRLKLVRAGIFTSLHFTSLHFTSLRPSGSS